MTQALHAHMNNKRKKKSRKGNGWAEVPTAPVWGEVLHPWKCHFTVAPLAWFRFHVRAEWVQEFTAKVSNNTSKKATLLLSDGWERSSPNEHYLSFWCPLEPLYWA
jgi:hypothetical protein